MHQTQVKASSTSQHASSFWYFGVTLSFWRPLSPPIRSPSELAGISSSSSPEPWQCAVCEGSSICRQIASCRLLYAGPDGPPVEGGGGDVNVDITAACAVLWQPLQDILVAVCRVNQLKPRENSLLEHTRTQQSISTCLVVRHTPD
jgi:hypothetical protein